MRTLRDFRGDSVRLTDERREHILEHPEMKALDSAIEETLAHPEVVVESKSDADARLYYRMYYATRVGDKFLCVVVKGSFDDAFIVTAYLTDRVKNGRILWTAKS